jgi:multidrug efflux system membrane fusion protein
MLELKPNTTTPENSHPLPPEKPVPGSQRHWTWLILVCLLVAGAVVLLLQLQRRTALQASPAKPAFDPPAVQVATAVARKGDIGVYVNALGAVTPVNTVMVKSRVDGQLMNVNYVEGQAVHEGDSLVEIDPRPYQAQVTQTEGQLARDKALLENAHVDLERYQIAYSKNAIPKQQLDTQIATVHQYEGTVKFDQGQVDNAKLQLTYSRITAPISGRVGLRLVDPGNIVHASDANPLAVITQLQPITVLFSVAQDYLPQIQQQLLQGQKLVVEAYDRTQQKKLATGTLLTMDNQIDATTGTVKLKALFPNDDYSLFPNQFVNAKLLVRTERDATVVPTAAIKRNAQEAFVYVVQTNQTVAMRPVSVGATDGSVAAVQGLEPGEVIAADNFNRLQEGIKVAIRKPAEEPKPGSGKATKMAVGSAMTP